LQLSDALINPARPIARKFRPIGTLRHAIAWKFRQFCPNLFESEPEPLGEDNEGDPP
jgi:hypothetical protein